MRGFRPIKMQLWRELAYLSVSCFESDDRADLLCKPTNVDGSPSNRSVPHCQYRYPSPRRSGPFGSRPTPLFLRGLVDLCRVAPWVQKTLVLHAQRADSNGNKPTQNSMQNKGSTLCLNSVFFSPLRLSRLFRSAWTMTSNVVLQGPLRALSSQAPQVAMLSQVQLSAAPLARCATKSLVSAAKANAPLAGAFIQFDRRAGFLLRGGFAF